MLMYFILLVLLKTALFGRVLRCSSEGSKCQFKFVLLLLLLLFCFCLFVFFWGGGGGVCFVLV